MTDNLHVRNLALGAGDFELRAAPGGDGLTLSGYIARFGEPATIEDFLGHYTEELQRSAFSRTLAERGAGKIKMQVNHGADVLFGALPIGVWTELREDRKGLFGVGRLHDTWHTVPIRAALESQALDGMSFKFRVIADQWRKGDPEKNELDHRVISEVALFEAGPVVHPAYEGTSVGLRSRALDMWRRELASPCLDAGHVDESDMLPTVTAAVPVDGTVLTRTEADPPVGITRREMRIRALTALGICNADQDRNAS